MGRRAVDRARDRKLSRDLAEVGQCKVSAVLEKPDGLHVRLEELGDWEVSWKYLLEGRDEWRERYGKEPLARVQPAATERVTSS